MDLTTKFFFTNTYVLKIHYILYICLHTVHTFIYMKINANCNFKHMLKKNSCNACFMLIITLNALSLKDYKIYCTSLITVHLKATTELSAELIQS